MTQFSLWSRLKKSFLKSRRHSTQGFTLLELLVVVAIAGGIVAGLTYIVVQLMTSDQREAARSETQREMQMALDYMSTELREAVYVYPGDYLECSRINTTQPCTPFSNWLPAGVRTDSVPVLAFWKQQPFPAAVKTRCAAANQPGISCLAGQSYALVVYSLRRNQANDPRWKGSARITRYVLSQFNSDGTPNPGYVDPGLNRNMTTWPFGAGAGGTFTNLQAGAPTGQADTLVDFVAFNFQDATTSNQIGQSGFCPDLPTEPGASDVQEYNISPSNNMLTGAFTGVRSFYACVAAPTRTASTGGTRVVLPDDTQYRDIILFLRGSAAGRPGMVSDRGNSILRSTNQEVLPTLQTRVLSRSVLGRRPAE